MIGLGTAAIGRPEYINIRQENADNFSQEAFRAQGFAVLDEAYRQGIRYFDTAPGYGMAEQLLGKWGAASGHDDIELATKWGYTYTANFQRNATQHEVKEHSLAKLNAQWSQSRKLLPLLGTYQIHSATLESGVLDNAEVLDRLAELKSAHGIRIGLSSSGTGQAEVIQRSREIERDGQQLFDVFQVTYNILEQSLAGIIRELQQDGKRVVIKEAIANGRLFRNPAYPHYSALYEGLESLARKYKVGVDAIALRFCLDSLNPFTVLSGAAAKSHITENLKASGFQLEAQELADLQQFGIAKGNYWSERKALRWN